MAELIPAAEAFAAILAEVVNGTVSADVEFVVTPFQGPPELAWVFPAGSTPAKPALIPIVAGFEPGAGPRLWLRTLYQVRLDDSGEHLAVVRSVFALVIDAASNRPAVRVEYDRDQGNEPDDDTPARHRRSAAHVQIHGASEELAYAQGLAGIRSMRSLDKFHIPVGGRRFRPSLEDFIEFLWTERLVPGLHDGWQDVLTRHRSDWLALQLRAAVRGDPSTAAAQLMQMGYSVVPPAGA
ncbi:MAG: hypothetical protein KDB40_02485 [Acidimicrobiales bacterium]|nr:hypothetical protein [Acidimicrobiales bacterium]MCB9393274.1 hypothetical protein [Acidimicrobiaceae bacterium]